MVGEFDRELGRKLRAVRRAKGVSQQEMGQEIGVSPQQIQKYERGADRVSVSRLVKIAAALNVPPTYFLDPLAEGDKAERLLATYHAFPNDYYRELILDWMESMLAKSKGKE